MIKNITGILFSSAIEVDNSDKIINTPKKFSNFIGQPFSILEQQLRKQKYHSLIITNVEETE
jgi:hypothetical protein